MAKDSNPNLFSRLTSLFRSGPVIKRTVKDFKAQTGPGQSLSAYEMFRKNHSSAYSSAMSAYGTYDRLARYSDFSEMDYYPEINSALDIYSEEVASPGVDGLILSIYSENKDIERLLNELLFDTLNVNFNLTAWVRNLPVHKDTVIPLLDGSHLTISELAQRMKSEPDWQPWVYAVQDGTNQTVPGRVTWCDLTRKDTSILRIWLDDGSYVDCTPDHEWVLRDGSRKKAEDLSDGVALMPFYREVSTKKHRLPGYEIVYNPPTETYEFTHRLVSASVVPSPALWHVVHHVNFNKRDNTPGNLRKMTRRDHTNLHMEASKILQRPDVAAKRMAGIDKWLRSSDHRKFAGEQLKRLQAAGLMRSSWSDYNASPQHAVDNVKRAAVMKRTWETKRDEMREKITINFDEKCVDLLIEVLMRVGKFISLNKAGRHLVGDKAFMSYFTSINPWNGRDLTRSVGSAATLKSLLGKAGVRSYYSLIEERIPEIACTPWFKRARKKSERLIGIVPKMRENHAASHYMNHKVVRVERLKETSDVYCMEVLGPQGEHDRHNFAVLTRDVDGSVKINSGIYSQNCKYGDFVLFNDVHPGNGVRNVIPIPVNEIEREENYDPKDPMAVRYRWITQGNTPLENWQVTHFRLLGNDAFLPYGSSVLEGARRVWRQLVLAEDAMLVYRVVRSPDRRVFYIDVGNVPPEEVPMYMEQAQAALKKSQVVDKNTGRVDMRYNPMPIHHGTPVPLLDGTTPTIAEISRRMAEDPSWTPWVYSVQDGTKRVVPGKVVWCGKNYTADRLIRVWLDDGTQVTTAPEHPFVMRDGTARRADELQAGESLMSAYRDLNNRGYERIVEPCGDRNHTHVIVARDVHREKWDTTPFRVVHHRHPEMGSSNKLNNVPDNLEVMNFWEHRAMHALHCELTLNRPELLSERRIRRIKFNKSPEKRLRTADTNRALGKAKRMGEMYNGSELHASHNTARRDAQLQSWSESKDTRKEAMQWIIPNEVVAFVFDTVKKNAKVGREEITEAIRGNESLMDVLRTANAGNKRNTHKFHVNAVVSKLHRMGCISSDKFGPFRKFAWTNPAPVNHQVTRVEVIEGAADDVYCMTVVGSRGEDDRHNFAVNGLGEQSGLKSLIFLRNSVDEDYFIPVRGGESGTKIDTLSGGTNAAAIEDVQYIQKKLFAALKIPKAYLGYDESIGCFAGETRIPLLSGRTATIEDLAREYDAGTHRDDWVYSSTPEGDFRAGKIVKAWRTKDVSEVAEVTLDDGSVLRCTGNHLFMLRDGTYRRADQLVSGTSLMPLYRKHSSRREGDFGDGYERILDNRSGEWIYTHQAVARQGLVKDHESCEVERHHVIHHTSYNKLNNNPDMLVRMGRSAHARHHAENAANITSPAARERLRVVMRSDAYRTKHVRALRQAWHPDVSQDRRKSLRSSNLLHRKIEKMHTALRKLRAEGRLIFTSPHLKPTPSPDEIRRLIASGIWRKEMIRQELSCSHLSLDRVVREMGAADWFTLVAAVRPDLRIPGSRLWTLDLDRHAQIASVCKTRQEFISSVDVSRCGFENFLRRREISPKVWYEQNLNKGNHSVVSVTVVKLDCPIPVYDIEIEGWSNFTVLTGDTAGSPASGVVVHNSKATLSQEDIRFSRTIARIQRTVIAELNKLAIIHLYSNGFEGDDLLDFTLQLPNPSTIAQQQKLDLYGTRFDIVSKAPEGYFDKRWLRKNLLGLTDEQIEEIEEGRIKDKLRELELEKVQAEAEGGGMTDEPEASTGGEIGAGDDSPPPPPAPPSETPVTAGPPAAGAPAPGGPPPGGPAPLDELQYKISDEEAPVRAQRVIDRSVRNLAALPVVLSEASRARAMKKGETAEDHADRLRYNAKRRKPGGVMRSSVDHNELVSHDPGDKRDAIRHPYGEKSDYAPSLKDLAPTVDEDSAQDIDELVNKYTTSSSNDLNATLRSLRAGLPRGEEKE